MKREKIQRHKTQNSKISGEAAVLVGFPPLTSADFLLSFFDYSSLSSSLSLSLSAVIIKY